MLTVHHMGMSQSERIVWLCEELGIEYKLVRHHRDPLKAPESLSSVPGNATGKAPFVEDPEAEITLSESSAICEYIITKYGSGRLALSSSDKKYAEYLHWFHYANSTLQMLMMCTVFVDLTGVPSSNPAKQLTDQRLHASLQLMDDRLAKNKWLVGDKEEDFSAADIMTVYSLTTQRYFGPLVSLVPYKNIVRYLQDCGHRPGYQRAMEKGDPEMAPLLTAEAPKMDMFRSGGINSSHWKKSSNAHI